MKKRIKRLFTWFYLNHPKFYTLLILIIGIALGCTYMGKGEDGSYYFNCMGYMFYMGAIK